MHKQEYECDALIVEDTPMGSARMVGIVLLAMPIFYCVLAAIVFL